MLLAPYTPPASGHADTAAAAAAAAMPQDGVFAVMTKLGRSAPRIFAVRGRDTFLKHMQQEARKKLAMSIIGRCLHWTPRTLGLSDSSCPCGTQLVANPVLSQVRKSTSLKQGRQL